MSTSATPSLAPFQVECPACGAEYPVAPERVPPEGIRAICSACMRAFPVELPGALEEDVRRRLSGQGMEPEASIAEPTRPPDAEELTPDSGEPAPDLEAGTREAEPGVAQPRMQPPEPEVHDLSSLTEEALAEDEADAGDDAPAGDAALSRGLERFGRRDPHERARRLARVLVSDIIAYYPEKHAEAVEKGTVKEEFEEEVQKSWKEYVDQVGHEIAESTDYFTEALNEVLARGKQIY